MLLETFSLFVNCFCM